MTAERFRRLEEIFHRALELQGVDRLSYLEQACVEDQGLLAEVQQMLSLEEGHESDQILDGAVGAGLDQWSSPELPPRIGPYRILKQLGRGGLGTVFLAERDDEHFHKRVAIKQVRPELGSPELEERFRTERQILAGLDHPNIARILDGGAHEGAPYIVMELVEGLNLLDHCRQLNLSLRQKLQLFRKVCDAAHYAHQNLVLHCDLKPSNILVDDQGLPKLVDFGIAKALHGSKETSGSAPESAPTFRPLTPNYASPEQAAGRSLTTSSDIYSLGLVLYELICDQPAYRIRVDDPKQLAEQIRAVSIPAPSLKYQPESLSFWGRRPAGWGPDLDAIVAKTVQKNPNQRYRSIEQLSEDLLRYLQDRPVIARQGTPLYFLGKLLRRHRWAVSAASLVAFSLVSATVVTTHQAQVAEAERRRAEVEKDRAEAVVELLVGLFEMSDPTLAQGAEITAREVLDQGSRRIRQDLKHQPVLQADLASTIGRVYYELSSLDQAEMNLLDSLEIRRRQHAPDSPKIVDSLLHLAVIYLAQDRAPEAEELLSQGLALESSARGKSSRAYNTLLRTLARSRLKQSQTEEARSLLEQSLSAAPEAGNADLADRAEAWDLLAQIAYSEGNYKEAERLGLQGLEGRRQSLGDGNPKVAVSLNNVAAIRQAKGDLAGARQVLKETLDMRRRVYGDHHGAVVLSLQNLANVLLAEGDLESAEQQLTIAASVAEQVYGPDHTATADVLHSQAELHSRRGQGKQAVELQSRALAIRRLRLNPGHPRIIFSLVRLGDFFGSEDPQREATYREAVAAAKEYAASHANPSPDHLAYPLERLGGVLCSHSPEEAAGFFQQAWDLRRDGPYPEHWATAMAQARLGRCLLNLDRRRGIAHLTEAAHDLEGILGPDHNQVSKVRRWLQQAAPDDS